MLEQYAQKAKELHGKLNNPKYTGDVNAEYDAFWEEYKGILDGTHDLLGHRPYRDVTCHDCSVDDFSQKRNAATNDYTITFNVKAFVYDVESQQVGRMKINFSFISKEKWRAIANKQIFDLVIDTETKRIMLMQWTNVYKRQVSILSYREMSITPQV